MQIPKDQQSPLQKRRLKLRIKSQKERELIDTYYINNKKEWNRKQLKYLSKCTGLSDEQIYKYLWNKKNKQQEQHSQRKCSNNRQIKVFYQNKEEGNFNLYQEDCQGKRYCQKEELLLDGVKQIQISEKVSIHVPNNLLFVKEFIIPKTVDLPENAINLLSQFGLSLTLQI